MPGWAWPRPGGRSIEVRPCQSTQNITISPSLDTILYPGDTITVCGNDEDVGRFSN